MRILRGTIPSITGAVTGLLGDFDFESMNRFAVDGRFRGDVLDSSLGGAAYFVMVVADLIADTRSSERILPMIESVDSDCCRVFLKN